MRGREVIGGVAWVMRGRARAPMHPRNCGFQGVGSGGFKLKIELYLDSVGGSCEYRCFILW
jgi:hypothetical protein